MGPDPKIEFVTQLRLKEGGFCIHYIGRPDGTYKHRFENIRTTRGWDKRRWKLRDNAFQQKSFILEFIYDR